MAGVPQNKRRNPKSRKGNFILCGKATTNEFGTILCVYSKDHFSKHSWERQSNDK